MADMPIPHPPHVPEHLVRDFDYYAVEGADNDPHAAWKRVQEREPAIFWTPHYGGHWVLTRGSDMKAVAGDHATFSSTEPGIPSVEGWIIPAPIGFDPPDHGRLKQMGVPRFTPRAISGLDQGCRDLANQLIDRFVDKGRCEFVGDFALILPTHTFGRLAGVPDSDVPELLHHIETKVRQGTEEERAAASLWLNDYSKKIIADRIERPGDDLITHLIEAAPGGIKASDDELIGYVTLMWAAGLDTVSSSMGFIARFLAENPSHRQQLLDAPELVPQAVEEFTRRFGLSQLARVVTTDTALGDVEMRKGDMVQLPSALYGLDERVFDNPMEVDFTRPNAAQSLVFGWGIHRCIGSFLARTELRIFLDVWLKRIPHFAVDPAGEIRASTGLVNSMLSLPLVWDVPAK